MTRRRALLALLVICGLLATGFVLFDRDQPGPQTTSTMAPVSTPPAVTTPSVAPSNPSGGPSPSSPPSTPTATSTSTSTSTAIPGATSIDLSEWSNAELAAQLVFTGVTMDDPAAMRRAAAAGVGGITLFGKPTSTLATDLRRARAAAPKGRVPFIASDEEGGKVQRLAEALGPLPSAKVMGTWESERITARAEKYATGMRRLGVDMAFGPTADLAVPGQYIAELGRGFSADPAEVARAVNAWTEGLEAGGVAAVVKHWPGHGDAVNTHTDVATTPPLSRLINRDLKPFRSAFATDVPAVMVGHLRVPGLTEAKLPATQSPAALRLLRTQAGSDRLIVTDDLSMAAASTELGISPAKAAVRSLVAGADVALVCWTPLQPVLREVRAALESGELPRAQAEASVRRILAAKAAVRQN